MRRAAVVVVLMILIPFSRAVGRMFRSQHEASEAAPSPTADLPDVKIASGDPGPCDEDFTWPDAEPGVPGRDTPATRERAVHAALAAAAAAEDRFESAYGCQSPTLTALYGVGLQHDPSVFFSEVHSNGSDLCFEATHASIAGRYWSYGSWFDGVRETRCEILIKSSPAG